MVEPPARPSSSLVFRTVGALAAGLIALSPFFGAPMPFAWLAVAVPWAVYLRRRRISAALILSTIVCGLLFVLLAALVLTAVTHLPALLTMCIVFALIAACGGALIPPGALAGLRTLTANRVLTIAAPLTGTVVWLGVRLASLWVPGASTTAWATLNDGANSLLFGRQILIDGGIRLGVGENPVPLPAAIIAAMTMPGRPESSFAAHDVYAYIDAWTLIVAVLCVAIGLLCLTLVRRSATLLSLLGPALASLLPLSWIIGGLTLEYGYINVAPTLLLLVAAVIATVEAERTPALSLSVIIMAGMLIMTCWSPLTLIPALLAMVVLVRERIALLRLGAPVKIVIVVLMLLALVFALLFVLPTFNASREAIESNVSFYPFRLRSLAVVAVLALVFGGLLSWRRRDSAPLFALLAVLVGGCTAVGVFLYTRRGLPSLWAYYPYKALWFVLIMTLILAVVFAIAALSELTPRTWAAAVGVVAVGAGTVVFGAWSNTVPGYASMNMPTRILSGSLLVDKAGDAAWTRILHLADEKPRGILWRSGDPNESFIDFWTVKLASPGFDNLELHVLAYNIDPRTTRDLCRFAEIVGPALQVETADAALVDEVAACHNPKITVEVKE
jgi:hypothetical protein